MPLPGYREDEIKLLEIQQIECFVVEREKTYAYYADGKRYHIRKRLCELGSSLPGNFPLTNPAAVSYNLAIPIPKRPGAESRQ